MKTQTDRMQREFDKAMSASAELLGEVLLQATPHTCGDDFLVFELAQLLENGEPSFEDPDFRFLIHQGIRLEYEDDLELRSRFVAQLRTAFPTLPRQTRRVASHLTGAIEDIDFPLHRIGAVVRYYTHHLFERLEQRASPSPTDALENAIEQWQVDSIDDPEIITELGQTREAGIGAVETLLIASADHPEVAAAVVEWLGNVASSNAATSGSGTAAQLLAFAISEPLLSEELEARSCTILQETWPAARICILYKLRQHTHEDIPFRWMELLITSGEPQAVDRILEEVLLHAGNPDFSEDLKAVLDLTGRSLDPGREGKVRRLMNDPRVSAHTRKFVTDWAGNSPAAAFLHEQDGDDSPQPVFIELGDDFSAFTTTCGPGSSLKEVMDKWNAAYDEALGWQQRSRLPRSDFEERFDQDLEDRILDQFSFEPRPDEASLRQLTESLREERITVASNGDIPLLRIYRERPRNTPWLERIYMREINTLYIQASGLYDAGHSDEARQELARLLEIEPGYPLARMLKKLIPGDADSTS